jgi:AcrR family transcriptional regulator
MTTLLKATTYRRAADYRAEQDRQGEAIVKAIRESGVRNMSTVTRNPEATRARILEAAFQEFYHHGFQGGSLNRIADAAGATKGALFHHFDGKNALGYAVVDEVLRSGRGGDVAQADARHDRPDRDHQDGDQCEGPAGRG